MRITLINPMVQDPLKIMDDPKKIQPKISPPLGLAYVGAVLENDDVEVEIVDMHAERMTRTELQDHITSFQPDVVGIGTLTPTFYSAIEEAQSIKEVDPHMTIVFGGVHPSFMYEETLQNYSCVDIVVIGEGEYTMRELARALDTDQPLEDVEGIAYRKDTTVCKTGKRPLVQNLDELPIPARHLFNMDLYPPYKRGSISTSRGCPFKCIFCSASAFNGHKVRYHSVERVLKEIEQLRNMFGCREITFNDDLFAFDPQRVIQVCQKIKERNLDIKWGCDARIDSITPELLQTMRDAGCTTILFGAESFSQKVLDTIGKHSKVEDAKRALKWTRDAGILCQITLVLGLPGEDDETFKETLSFLEEFKPKAAWAFFLSPYPGTEIYSNPEKFGLTILHKKWDRYGDFEPLTETPTISPEKQMDHKKQFIIASYGSVEEALRKMWERK
jgi:anaerobic magnesium-protoporphyrin IX monomethyl ester cyclase